MIQSLSIGSVISRAFSTWFDHFLGFFVLALVLSLPMLPLELAPLFSDTASQGGPGMLQWLGGLLRAIAGYLLTGVVVLTVFQSLKGESGTIMDSISRVKSQLFSIVGAAILVSIAVGVGIVLCVIPGIFLALILVVTIPVIVVEKTGVFDAMSRSYQLTEGSKVQIFVIYLVYFGIMVAVLFATSLFLILAFGFGIGATSAELISDGDLSGGIIVLAALFDHGTDALIMPLQATLATVIYHDLRQINDGVGIDEMFADVDGDIFPDIDETSADGASGFQSETQDPDSTNPTW